jgi:hypothetical protein
MDRLGTGKGGSSHVAAWSISFADNKVSARVVVPSHVERAASEVVEVDIGVIIGPILDRETILARSDGLRSSSCQAGDGRNNTDDRFHERDHDEINTVAGCTVALWAAFVLDVQLVLGGGGHLFIRSFRSVVLSTPLS